MAVSYYCWLNALFNTRFHNVNNIRVYCWFPASDVNVLQVIFFFKQFYSSNYSVDWKMFMIRFISEITKSTISIA